MISKFEEIAKSKEVFDLVCDKIQENLDKINFQGEQPEETINPDSEFKQWTK